MATPKETIWDQYSYPAAGRSCRLCSLGLQARAPGASRTMQWFFERMASPIGSRMTKSIAFLVSSTASSRLLNLPRLTGYNLSIATQVDRESKRTPGVNRVPIAVLYFVMDGGKAQNLRCQLRQFGINDVMGNPT